MDDLLPVMEVTVPQSDILKLVTTLLNFPNATICRHNVVGSLLDILERNGYPLTLELAEAVGSGQDERALKFLAKH